MKKTTPKAIPCDKCKPHLMEFGCCDNCRQLNDWIKYWSKKKEEK